MRQVIEVDLTEDYPAQLKARMDAAGVSQNALAKEMGLSPSQVSRWFTTSDRRVDMLMSTALEVERAILRIQSARAKKAAPKKTTTTTKRKKAGRAD